MKNSLRQKILNELKFLIAEQVDTGTLGKDVGRTAKAAGIATTSVASLGILAIPAVASFFSRSPLELRRAIKIASRDPKGLADFIKAQMSSNYIDDKESETMVGLARAYQTYCNSSGDNNWCKKAVSELGDYKQLLDTKWAATEVGGQKEDKMELIDILEEFEKMKPGPAPIQPSTSKPPSPAPAPVQQTGKYFRCKNKDDVAVFQQYLGVVVDCMIGPDTMSKAIEKGTKINLQDLQDPQKQASFCTSLQTNRQGYVDAIKKTNQAVKKCPVAGSVKKNSSKNNAVVSKQEFEKSLQQTIKSKLNAGQNREEVEKWAEDQRQSWARQIYKESKNYYDNKKLNEAKQLFDKLLKGL